MIVKKQTWKSYLAYIGLGAVSGIGTAAVLILYKYLAERVIHLSEGAYHHLRHHLWWVPAAVAVMAAVAWLLSRIYRRLPNLQGGGIPASISAIRGTTFCWWRTLIGTFTLSLSSFLLGVPLGNEGPAVQIGTAMGRGASRLTDKRHADWARYAMTGGACAGFAIATGAPVAGILFGLEEAHRKMRPSLLAASVSAVGCATVVARRLAPVLGVSTALFSWEPLPTLPLQAAWIPLLVGVTLGLLAVGFLSYYRVIRHVLHTTLGRVPQAYKIGGVLLLTLAVGLVSGECLSTGHHLTLSLYEGGYALWVLAALLVVRTTLTLSATVSGITGGTFVPTLVLGALGAALLGSGLTQLGMDAAYYPAIITLGLVACVAGMMKMPITAVAFAVEALGCRGNLPSVLVVCVVPYFIVELCGTHSIIEMVLEAQAKHAPADAVQESVCAAE